MVYVFLADGFEELEAIAPVDILRRAGLQLRTVGVGGKRIVGSHGIPVQADITEAEVDLDAAELIVLPGGLAGTENLSRSDTVRRALLHAAQRGAWIGAICAAPSVPGQLGLLEGHRATCFPGFEGACAGAEMTGERVVTSGRIVTGKGAGAAVPFALELVARLVSPEKAAQLAASMQ